MSGWTTPARVRGLAALGTWHAGARDPGCGVSRSHTGEALWDHRPHVPRLCSPTFAGGRAELPGAAADAGARGAGGERVDPAGRGGRARVHASDHSPRRHRAVRGDRRAADAGRSADAAAGRDARSGSHRRRRSLPSRPCAVRPRRAGLGARRRHGGVGGLAARCGGPARRGGRRGPLAGARGRDPRARRAPAAGGRECRRPGRRGGGAPAAPLGRAQRRVDQVVAVHLRAPAAAPDRRRDRARAQDAPADAAVPGLPRGRWRCCGRPSRTAWASTITPRLECRSCAPARRAWRSSHMADLSKTAPARPRTVGTCSTTPLGCPSSTLARTSPVRGGRRWLLARSAGSGADPGRRPCGRLRRRPGSRGERRGSV